MNGVHAECDGRSLYLRARAGVLLATGGFAGSEELKRLWLSRPLDASCEVDSNTGDGHLMGLAAGAAVAGLGDAWWMPQIQCGVEPDGSPAFVGSREDRTVPHVMAVNRDARRFVNEAMNYYDACEAFGTKTGGGPRNNPAWFVFDTQAREKYSVIAGKFPDGEVPPWMAAAGSPAELARSPRRGRRPCFRATIERFNAFARSGVDEDFGRGVSEWDRAWGDPVHRPNPSLGTLEAAPFYALQIRSGALATRGGLRVSARGEVRSALPPFAPIGGLYRRRQLLQRIGGGRLSRPRCDDRRGDDVRLPGRAVRGGRRTSAGHGRGAMKPRGARRPARAAEMPETRRRARARRPRAPELAADTETGAFLRRLALLGVMIAGLLALGALAYAAIEHSSVGYGVGLGAGYGDDGGRDPGAGLRRGRAPAQIDRRDPARDRYPLLRLEVSIAEFFVAGHLRRVAGDQAHAEDDRLAHRPSHRLRLRPAVGRQVVRDLRAAQAPTYVIVDSKPGDPRAGGRPRAPFRLWRCDQRRGP